MSGSSDDVGMGSDVVGMIWGSGVVAGMVAMMV